MKNYAVEKIEAHKGNLYKQQQVGDNHLYASRNPHVRLHVSSYMIENQIPSRFDLSSIKESSLKNMQPRPAQAGQTKGTE